METLRIHAGRKSWPHDIDCMASWPQRPLGQVQRQPQDFHQDGCFSMLACTVFTQQSQGTIFGDYLGKDIMAMGHESRVSYLKAAFDRVEGGNCVQTGTMYSGDAIFFHTGHIHKAPPPRRCTRAAQSGTGEPRRTFFFGFDSDQKTCETEFIRKHDMVQHWDDFKDGNVQKHRREIRREALAATRKEESEMNGTPSKKHRK